MKNTYAYLDIAVNLAIKEYGKDIGDLPENIQSRLYEKAIDEVFNRDVDRADNLREARKEGLEDGIIDEI